MSPPKAKLLITERALRDIAEIEAYSIAEWEKRTAARYLDDIEAALTRIQERPELLQPDAGFHGELCFYRVNKHLLCCEWQPKAIFLLTVVHASHDTPSRLADLAPTRVTEAELLHRQLEEGKKRRCSVLLLKPRSARPGMLFTS